MNLLERLVAEPAPARSPAAGIETLPGPLGARRPPAPGASCDLCGETLGPDHRHVVDLEQRALVCACRACVLVLDRPGAGGHRYQAVPERYQRLAGLGAETSGWATLGVPVGMAFFVEDGSSGAVTAFYPSPGGATESLLDLGAWADVRASTPELATVEPDVEAVLVRSAGRAGSAGERAECFIVPVDRCYELVGELRRAWKGFDGGEEVRRRIDAFFADVGARAEGRRR